MTEPLAVVPDAPDEAPKTAVFMGETFAINDDVSDWVVAEFASAATRGEDAATLQGMASLYDFVIELVAESDRDRFRGLARRKRAKFTDLVAFITGEVEAETERPTGPSADSSDGREITGPKSDPNSVASTSRFAGRPDLALVIERAQAAQAG